MGNTTLINQDKTFVAGKPFVTQWANFDATTRESLRASLTPYQDRIFFTDIGIGGSEWYSDGSRWRAVGGQVVFFDGNTGAQTVNSTNIGKLLSVNLSGVAQAGDSIEAVCTLSKPNSANTYDVVGYIGSSDTAINSSSTSTLAIQIGLGIAGTSYTTSCRYAIKIMSATSTRLTAVSYSTSGFGTVAVPLSDQTLSAATLLSSLYVGIGAKSNVAADIITLNNFTVILRTIG